MTEDAPVWFSAVKAISPARLRFLNHIAVVSEIGFAGSIALFVWSREYLEQARKKATLTKRIDLRPTNSRIRITRKQGGANFPSTFKLPMSCQRDAGFQY